MLAGGSVAVVLLISWRLRRYQRDANELDQEDYRLPPVHGQAGPH